MHQYKYGDFVFGVSLEYDSVFYCEDYCLAMVVEPNDFSPKVLLLHSHFLNRHHPSCTNEDFIEEVKRIRVNPALYSTSAFIDQYEDFVTSPENLDVIAPLSPTKQGYDDMLSQLKILHALTEEPTTMEEPSLSFQTFRERYLPISFHPTSPKLSL